MDSPEMTPALVLSTKPESDGVTSRIEVNPLAFLQEEDTAGNYKVWGHVLAEIAKAVSEAAALNGKDAQTAYDEIVDGFLSAVFERPDTPLN